MNSKYLMLVVSIPKEHTDAVREAIGDAGAGTLGNYTHCSFSYNGIGRFIPNEHANPAYGEKGEPAEVDEERVEVLCERSKLKEIIAAMRKAHPYEEPAFHYFPVEIE